MNFENRIQLCNTMTPVENRIAQYIMENNNKIKDISIQELADHIFVSKSAIHRFCKKIGFHGFNELKVSIAQDLIENQNRKDRIDVNYPFEEGDDEKKIANRLLKLYETTIRDTYDFIEIENMKAIAKLMFHAEVIDIYTHAHNLNAAENFCDKMLSIGKVVHCPKSFYEQRMNVLSSNVKHVALIISYSGKATYIPTLTKALYEKKIPIVLMGKAGSNLFPQRIKYQIYISGKENIRERLSQFSSHIATQYMLDVLFGCIYNLDRRNNVDYLHKAIAFMDDREFDNE